MFNDVERCWGKYEVLKSNKRSQVKILTIDVGKSISTQYHHHRSEHWVVLKGVASVFLNKIGTTTLYEGQSIDVPEGQIHKLTNNGKIPLKIVEVQLGSYLGEDDIHRIGQKKAQV